MTLQSVINVYVNCKLSFHITLVFTDHWSRIGFQTMSQIIFVGPSRNVELCTYIILKLKRSTAGTRTETFL